MRATRTRAWPRSISRVLRKGKACRDTSSGLTRAINSGAMGPMRDKTLYMAVTSVRLTPLCGAMWRRIQSMSRVTWAEPVISKKISVAKRNTVKSLS